MTASRLLALALVMVSGELSLLLSVIKSSNYLLDLTSRDAEEPVFEFV